MAQKPILGRTSKSGRDFCLLMAEMASGMLDELDRIWISLALHVSRHPWHLLLVGPGMQFSLANKDLPLRPMDPFSLTVGSISLVTLAAKTIRVTSDYLREVRHGREAAAELLRELEVLHANLSRLDAFLRTKDASQPFESTSVLVCSTSACRTKLTQLHERLSSIGESRLTRLKWPLHSEEHRKTIEELRAFALWIQFALTIDGCALMSKTSSEVLETLKHQLETFQQIESIYTQTEAIAISLKQQAQDARDQRALEEREDVLAWLSTVKHEQKHHDVRMPHVAGTGELLEPLDQNVQTH